MRAISLHLFERGSGPGLGEVQLAAPGLSPQERIVLWLGLPPPPMPDHDNVAPAVIEGDIDGRQVYAEQVPRGVRMSQHAPPPELMPYVVSSVLQGLGALHDAAQVHGTVGPDRVVLGTDGQVVLIGRGRQGGHRGLDLISALSLLAHEYESTLLDADAGALSEEIAEAAHPGDRERLSRWVRGVLPERKVVEQVVLTIGELGDAVDEIVPDIGPDADGSGILDRWSLSSTPGAITDEVSATQPEIDVDLWGRIEVLPGGPDDRFQGVEGQPSRAIRSLVAEEAPDVLPLPLGGDIAAFVIHRPRYEDQPTAVREPFRDSFPNEVTLRRGSRVPAWVQWAAAGGTGAVIAWVILRLLA